jgi:hypothetical protein
MGLHSDYIISDVHEKQVNYPFKKVKDKKLKIVLSGTVMVKQMSS